MSAYLKKITFQYVFCRRQVNKKNEQSTMPISIAHFINCKTAAKSRTLYEPRESTIKETRCIPLFDCKFSIIIIAMYASATSCITIFLYEYIIHTFCVKRKPRTAVFACEMCRTRYIHSSTIATRALQQKGCCTLVVARLRFTV